MNGRMLLVLLAAAVLLPGLGGSLQAVGSEAAAGSFAGTDGDAATGFRRALVFVSGVLYWGGVLVQARRVRRKIGRTPNLGPRGTKERLLWLGWTIVVVGWIAQPFFVTGGQTAGSAFGLFSGLVHPASLVAGTLLVVLGYLGTLWCYAAMGAAWRIGIDTEGSSSLVQEGPYRCLRHPIYSFQMVMLVGAALLLPTSVSVAILLLHFVCASIKASDEEKHLARVFGEDYRRYLARSGRFFPKCRPGG